MNRHLLAGIAAGATAGFYTEVGAALFATHPWGIVPLLLGLLPFFSGLLFNTGLLPVAAPNSIQRYYAAILALLAPLLLFALYELTGGMSFISGKMDALSLLSLTLMYGLFAGIPIDALSERESGTTSPSRTLSGAGLAFAIIAMAAGFLPLPALWLLQAAPSALLALRFSGTTATEEQPRPEQKKRQTKQKGGLPAISPAATLLLLFAGILTTGMLLHTFSEMPFTVDLHIRVHAAFVVFVAGAGAWTGRRLSASNEALLTAILPAAGAAILLLAVWSYGGNGFASLYRAYYDGLDSSMWTLLFPTLFLLLPTFATAAGLSAALVMDSHESAQRRRLHTPTVVAIVSASGLLALAALADADAWRSTALAASALLLLFALYQTLRFYRRSLRSHVTAALILAAGVFAFTQWGNGFYGFLDPSRFRVLDEERSVAGRLSLLQSRDYDDPFFALLWRSKQSLTQSSRLVQSELYRMAHIPMLLAKERADVLVLGLGSALPLHGVVMHEPASVTCVEPFAPTIAMAAATRRSGRVRPWLQSVTFHAERIESFARRSDSRYDVIIGAEPFATPGIPASLLTRATIEHTAGLLTSNGLYAQWLPVSRVGVEGVRSVAAAMGEVFPHIELWISGPDPENAMAGIIGFASKPPVGIPSPERLAALLSSQGSAFHFRIIEIDNWSDLAVCWSMSDQSVRAFSAGAAAPSIFSPLRTRDPEQDAARVWTDVRSLLTARSEMREFPRAAPDSLLLNVEQMYADRITILDARVLALQGDDQQAVSTLSDVLRRFQGNTEARHAFAGIMLRQAAGYVGEEKYGPALQLLNAAMAIVPLNTYLLRLLMIAGFQTGDREAAGLSIDGLKRLDPLHAGYRDNQATIRAQQGATNDALLLYESAITVDPYNEEIYCNMASFHFSQQRIWEAVRVLDEARARAWYPARALYLQGLFYAEQGRFDFARESWEQYLRIATPIDPWLTEIENRLRALPSRK